MHLEYFARKVNRETLRTRKAHADDTMTIQKQDLL